MARELPEVSDTGHEHSEYPAAVGSRRMDSKNRGSKAAIGSIREDHQYSMQSIREQAPRGSHAGEPAAAAAQLHSWSNNSFRNDDLVRHQSSNDFSLRSDMSSKAARPPRLLQTIDSKGSSAEASPTARSASGEPASQRQLLAGVSSALLRGNSLSPSHSGDKAQRAFERDNKLPLLSQFNKQDSVRPSVRSRETSKHPGAGNGELSSSEPSAEEKRRRLEQAAQKRARDEERSKADAAKKLAEEAGKKADLEARLETRKAAIRERIQRQHEIHTKMAQDRARASEASKEVLVKSIKSKPLFERLQEEFEARQKAQDDARLKEHEQAFRAKFSRASASGQADMDSRVGEDEASLRPLGRGFQGQLQHSRSEPIPAAELQASLSMNRKSLMEPLFKKQGLSSATHVAPLVTAQDLQAALMQPVGTANSFKDKPRLQGMMLYSTSKKGPPAKLQPVYVDRAVSPIVLGSDVDRAVSPFVFSYDGKPLVYNKPVSRIGSMQTSAAQFVAMHVPPPVLEVDEDDMVEMRSGDIIFDSVHDRSQDMAKAQELDGPAEEDDERTNDIATQADQGKHEGDEQDAIADESQQIDEEGPVGASPATDGDREEDVPVEEPTAREVDDDDADDDAAAAVDLKDASDGDEVAEETAALPLDGQDTTPSAPPPPAQEPEAGAVAKQALKALAQAGTVADRALRELAEAGSVADRALRELAGAAGVANKVLRTSTADTQAGVVVGQVMRGLADARGMVSRQTTGTGSVRGGIAGMTTVPPPISRQTTTNSMMYAPPPGAGRGPISRQTTNNSMYGGSVMGGGPPPASRPTTNTMAASASSATDAATPMMGGHPVNQTIYEESPTDDASLSRPSTTPPPMTPDGPTDAAQPPSRPTTNTMKPAPPTESAPASRPSTTSMAAPAPDAAPVSRPSTNASAAVPPAVGSSLSRPTTNTMAHEPSYAGASLSRPSTNTMANEQSNAGASLSRPSTNTMAADRPSGTPPSRPTTNTVVGSSVADHPHMSRLAVSSMPNDTADGGSINQWSREEDEPRRP